MPLFRVMPYYMFFNYTALYLLPLAIIVDWGIFQFSIQSVFKNNYWI